MSLGFAAVCIYPAGRGFGSWEAAAAAGRGRLCRRKGGWVTENPAPCLSHAPEFQSSPAADTTAHRKSVWQGREMVPDLLLSQQWLMELKVWIITFADWSWWNIIYWSSKCPQSLEKMHSRAKSRSCDNYLFIKVWVWKVSFFVTYWKLLILVVCLNFLNLICWRRLTTMVYVCYCTHSRDGCF